jgi:hypothetical protein
MIRTCPRFAAGLILAALASSVSGPDDAAAAVPEDLVLQVEVVQWKGSHEGDKLDHATN